MKYRTLIEIVTDAKDHNEAIDIAGEFLRGNLESGVKMKCSTKPLKSRFIFPASAFAVLLAIVLSLAWSGYFRNGNISFADRKHVSAVQPPLKTSEATNFKETWREERDKKVLDYIKK